MSPDLAIYAASSLGIIGPEAEEAIPALIQTLEDGEEHVRETAAEALGKITGQELGPGPVQWQEWWEGQQ